jgi:hypothetical protein
MCIQQYRETSFYMRHMCIPRVCCTTQPSGTSDAVSPQSQGRLMLIVCCEEFVYRVAMCQCCELQQQSNRHPLLMVDPPPCNATLQSLIGPRPHSPECSWVGAHCRSMAVPHNVAFKGGVSAVDHPLVDQCLQVCLHQPRWPSHDIRPVDSEGYRSALTSTHTYMRGPAVQVLMGIKQQTSKHAAA